MHLVVNGVKRGHVEQAAAYARLVGGNNNAVASLGQQRDCFQAARERAPLLRAFYVLVTVLVDDAVAIEDQESHAASLEISATRLSRALSSNNRRSLFSRTF